MTEYDKLFRYLSENKVPFSIIKDPYANNKVVSISPEFDKTMGILARATDENWSDLIGLLEVVILPNKKMGLQTAETVIQEVKELFGNLH